MNTVVKIQPKDVGSISFQEASYDIWDKKYRLIAKDGSPVDKSMDDTYKRVARALADVETEELSRAVVRIVSVGAAPWSHSGRPRHLERRRARSQAGHIDHQLHGVGHDPRFDGRHIEQGS